MKRKNKRILPLLLTLAMMFSCIPANVAAAETTDPDFTVTLDVVDQARTQVYQAGVTNSSIKVDLKVSAAEESSFSAADIKVKYDSSLVTYSSCTANAALTGSTISATTESSITSATECAVSVKMYGGPVDAGTAPVTVAQLTFTATHTGAAVFSLGDDTILAQKDSGRSSITRTLSDDDAGNTVTILPAGYYITLATTAHGTVKLTDGASQWAKGNIRLYFYPDSGYGLASVSITRDADGKGVYYGPGSYDYDYFVMPTDSDVTVNATFSKIVNVTFPGAITGGSITGDSTQLVGNTYTVTVSNVRGYGLSEEGLTYTTSESNSPVSITDNDVSDTSLYYFTVPDTTSVAIQGEFEALPLLNANIANVTNGTVTVNPAAAYPGETVEIDVTPDSGYALEAGSVKYITASGTEKAATKKSVGVYEFTMPKEKNDITVSAVFLSKTRSISTAAQFCGLANDVAESGGGTGWNITLGADIDLSGSAWIPIGRSGSPFNGTFDGAGHTVTLYADETAGNYCGLIGLAGTANVKDVTVKGEIDNPDYNISAGIVAQADSLTAVNCVNKADITGAGAVGGIAGYCTGNSSFTDCSNTGSVLGGGSVTGAIAGKTSGSAVFTSCVNTGIVFCTSCQDGALLGTGTVTDGGGNSNAGSIVKYNTSTGTAAISIGEANVSPDANGAASIELSAGLDIQTVDITIPNDLLTDLSESSTVKSLTMKTDAGRICFSKAALGEVLAATGTNDAVITISELTSSTNETAQELINDGTPVFSIGVSANSTAVLTGSVSGTITVSLPYTTTETGTVTVKKISDGGTKTNMATTYSDGFAVFTANQMSLYSVEFTAASETNGTTESAINASVWDGTTIDVSWFDKDKYSSTSKFYIGTPAQLAGLAAIVNGIYNEEINIFAGDTSCIVANWADGDGSGSKGLNMSTSHYCMGDYDFNGKTVYLTADIDMSDGNYMPIGGQYLMTPNDSATKISSSFCGTFDGQGHSVTIECSRRCSNGNFGDGESVGLIGRLGVHDNDPVSWRPKNPTVRNVAVYGSVYANRSVGGIVGKIGKTSRNNGDGSTGGIIENCANFASIKNTDAKGVGGIVGAGWNGGIIRNCYNMGSVTSTYTCPSAGISGSNEISIQNCYSVGKISALRDAYAMAIGTNNASAPYSVIKNCWYLDGSAPGGGYYTNSAAVNDGAMLSSEMKTVEFVNQLGSAFAQDINKLNKGYPILAWQDESAPVGTGETAVTDIATATVTVQATMYGSVAKASVTAEQMTQVVKDALETASSANAKPGIEIVVEASDSAKAVETAIPGTSLKSAVTSGIQSMKVSTPVGSVTFDAAALESMAKQAATGTATIGIKEVAESSLTDEQKALAGDAPVYGVSVTSNGKNITDYDSGVITISVPYVISSDDQDKTVHAYYLNSKGKLILMSGSYNKSTGMMEFTTAHLSMYLLKAEEKWSNPFTDVSAGDWFSGSVEHVSLMGLLSGTGPTTFSPSVSMTRAMLVTALWRMEGEPAAASAGFADAAEGKWYTGAVNWAAENGIVGGYDAAHFGPNDNVTRQQLAAILYRFAQADGYDVSKTTSLSAYTDKDSIANWAQTELTWANAAGLITGRTAATLLPGGFATRAEVSTILMRYQRMEL